MKWANIKNALQLKHDDFFRTNYIIPALESGYIEMAMFDISNLLNGGWLSKVGKVPVTKYIRTNEELPENEI